MKMQQHPLLDLRDASVIFRTSDIETHAVDRVSLVVHGGEFITIQGRSGSGKSTLLSALGLLQPLASGTLFVDGADCTHLNREQRAAVRRKTFGFVFQSFHLLPDLTVEENIALPMIYDGRPASHVRRRTADLISQFGLDPRRNHRPSQLSGGQQQRVAIARALANEPRVILVDEPTGNLDEENAAAVFDALLSMNAQGATICMVTHDDAAAAIGMRRLRMRDGRIIALKETDAPR